MTRLSSDLYVRFHTSTGKLKQIGLSKRNRKEETWVSKEPSPILSLKDRAQGPLAGHVTQTDDRATATAAAGGRLVYPG